MHTTTQDIRIGKWSRVVKMELRQTGGMLEIWIPMVNSATNMKDDSLGYDRLRKCRILLAEKTFVDFRTEKEGTRTFLVVPYLRTMVPIDYLSYGLGMKVVPAAANFPLVSWRTEYVAQERALFATA